MIATPATDPYAALRYPEFRYYGANSFLFTATLLIQEVILGYELYRITHDPLALGFIGLAEALPFIAMSLFGGHLADRREKRTILQISLSVIIIGSIVLYALFQPSVINRLSQTMHLGVIYGVFMLIGTAKGFYSPASNSLKPFLVPRELYGNSSTWSSTFWQAGAIAGPGIAGFLYVWLGLDNTLLVIIALLIICLILISMIKKRPVQAVEGPQDSLWTSLREGFRFVFGTKIILYSISLDLFSVLFGGVVAILPVFATDILHVGAEGLGVLRAAPSVGAIGTMFLLTRFPPTHNAWRNMLIAVLGFGIFTVVFALSTHFWLSAGALFLTGAFDSVSVVIRNTVLQVFPPDHMRGRVAAVNGIFVSSSNEIGAFESGLAARLFGAAPSVMVGGAGYVTGGNLHLLQFPRAVCRSVELIGAATESLIRIGLNGWNNGGDRVTSTQNHTLSLYRIMRLRTLLAGAGVLLCAALSAFYAPPKEKKLVKVWETDSTLRVPESVLYDKNANILYVANIDGKSDSLDGSGFISKVSLDGKIENLRWVGNLNAPKGMGIHKNRLYVTDVYRLVAIDIATGQVEQMWDATDKKAFLNDVTVDKDGTVYVSDNRNDKIYRLKDKTWETWISGGDINKPNGLLAVGTKKLMIGSTGIGALQAMDIETKALTKLADGMANTDGIVAEGKDSFFVSDWNGRIFHVTSAGKKQQLLDTREEKVNAADIEYVPGRKLIIVPDVFEK